MTAYLFVYGTLLPGCAPAEVASLATQLRPVCDGFVRGVLYDLGRYPGAVPDAAAHGKIIGTVMELPEETDVLRQLDAYEGYDPRAPEGSEFVRERQTVEMSDGRTVDCWFYRYNGSAGEAPAIESGAWRRQ
jgi:gamma-glutamylcyclotransferase (GGCT)/AIG2-like uncharacterized protein YtfP